MKCTHTGAVVHISSYQNRYICDVFKEHGVFVFRIAGIIPQARHNIHPITHTVSDQLAFFDKDSMSTSHNATLIAFEMDVETVSPSSEGA